MKMTQEINKTKLIGVIAEEITLNTRIGRREMYSTVLHIERKSGAIDIIPIKIPEKIIEEARSIKVGDTVIVEGELRTLNYFGEDQKSHLSVYVSAKKIEKISMKEMENSLSSNNEVYMTGYICKKTKLRYTPLGKKVVDIIIAVDKEYKNTPSYIPSIAWGRNAYYIQGFPKGTEVTVVGRIQSREYTKVYASGRSEIKTAIELSIHSIDVM